MYLDDTTLKRCASCGELKPRSSFYNSRSSSDGKYCYCKACKYLKNRAYNDAHSERVNAKQHEYYAANRERLISEKAEYYTGKRDEILEYQRQYREKNRKKKNEDQRLYHKANEGKATAQRRAARKNGLPCNFRAKDWRFALDYFGGCCAVCGRPPGLWHTLSADHWIPIKKGGGTTPDNIVPLCFGAGGCNNSKHTNDACEWLIARFGDHKGRAILRRIEAYLNSRKAEGSA